MTNKQITKLSQYLSDLQRNGHLSEYDTAVTVLRFLGHRVELKAMYEVRVTASKGGGND